MKNDANLRPSFRRVKSGPWTFDRITGLLKDGEGWTVAAIPRRCNVTDGPDDLLRGRLLSLLPLLVEALDDEAARKEAKREVADILEEGEC